MQFLIVIHLYTNKQSRDEISNGVAKVTQTWGSVLTYISSLTETITYVYTSPLKKENVLPFTPRDSNNSSHSCD